MKQLIFLLIIFILWIILWHVSYRFIKKRASSKIIIVGGSFILSCMLLALLSLLILPFISNKKEFQHIETANKVEKEQVNNIRINQILDTVKRLPCIQGGTVEEYLMKKTAVPAVKDLGWLTKDIKNGYLVEKIIQIDGLQSPTIYRWKIDLDGIATPVNGHAVEITTKSP